MRGRRFSRAGAHEDDEASALGEQGHLSLCVAAVNAMGVGVEVFANGEPPKNYSNISLGPAHFVQLNNDSSAAIPTFGSIRPW